MINSMMMGWMGARLQYPKRSGKPNSIIQWPGALSRTRSHGLTCALLQHSAMSITVSRGRRSTRRRSALFLALLLLARSSAVASASAADHDNDRRRKLFPECGPPYEPSREYAAGDIASNDGKNYECKPEPYDTWCGNDSYAPGVASSRLWAMAWTVRGSLCS